MDEVSSYIYITFFVFRLDMNNFTYFTWKKPTHIFLPFCFFIMHSYYRVSFTANRKIFTTEYKRTNIIFNSYIYGYAKEIKTSSTVRNGSSSRVESTQCYKQIYRLA